MLHHQQLNRLLDCLNQGLSEKGIERTIEDFVQCAVLAKEAGYDGVEVMGSEGYLINEFIAKRTK